MLSWTLHGCAIPGLSEEASGKEEKTVPKNPILAVEYLLPTFLFKLFLLILFDFLSLFLVCNS